MKILLRLAVYLRKHWLMLLLAFLCLLFGVGFGLAVPYMIGDGVDAVLGMGNRTYVIIAAIVVVAANGLRGAAQYGNRFFAEVVSQKATYKIRNDLYGKLQKLSFAFHDSNQTGQLMSRATVDVEAVRMFMGMGMLGILQVAFMFLGTMYILISMDWMLALLTVLFVIPVGWVTVSFHTRIRPIWLRIQTTLGFMGTTLEENLSGVRVVKAFSRQKKEINRFNEQAESLYGEQVKAARLIAFNMPTMMFLVSVPTALIIWYGGYQVWAGAMTLGEVTSFILYLGMLMMPMGRMGMMVNLIARTISAGQRIFEILDAQSTVVEKSDAIELGQVAGRVRFDNVNFSYNSLSAALINVSFEVKPGQLVALMGGSGSGKSTIANLLGRFYDVSGGRITIDGVDVRDVTLASLRKNVVAAQQDVFLFSNTIRNNIAYGDTDAPMDKIVEVAKAAYLHDFIQALPEGYDTWVGERGDTLSGGEKQRLSIARTLLMDPRILILDDSTASVDSETERLIRQALQRLIHGRTTFIITHRVSLIQNADLVLVLQDGKLVEQGKHADLIQEDGVYKRVYEAQLLINQELEEDLEEEQE
jgi:ATP-binding cassette subfamily B protein